MDKRSNSDPVHLSSDSATSKASPSFLSLTDDKQKQQQQKTASSKIWRISGDSSNLQQKLANMQPDATHLDLSHLNLDSFPKALLKEPRFVVLKELNLSANKITSIPPQINVLKNLVVLDLTFNRITDLPFELSDLPGLEFLNLSGNPLHKELTQRHLLGTNSVLQYLQERQATEEAKSTSAGRRSFKFGKISPSILRPTASDQHIHMPSPISPDQPTFFSNGSSNAPTPPAMPAKILRQRSNQAHQPPTPGDTPSNNPNIPPPPPMPSSPVIIEPRGDMGAVVLQLKAGIIHVETEKTGVIPTINIDGGPPPTKPHLNGSQTSTDSNNDQTNPLDSKTKFYLREGENRFTFNTYCVDAFLELRKLANISQERYLAALESISALGFAGKSGAVLLKSADGLLVLKTISKDEASFLRKILPQYQEYMAANPYTYLTQFWGLYKVIRSPIEKLNFVVMKNTMYTSKKIHERYDLKGSTVGRTTDEENVRRSRIVLKDLNFTRQIKLNEDRRKVFLEQLEKDAHFLEKFEIIDYSLILGVHYLSDPPDIKDVQEFPVVGEIIAMDKDKQPLDEVYFMGIIDMLQPFNIRKQMEYGLKSLRYGNGISVIPPSQYASRFLSFLNSVVE